MLFLTKLYNTTTKITKVLIFLKTVYIIICIVTKKNLYCKFYLVIKCIKYVKHLCLIEKLNTKYFNFIGLKTRTEQQIGVGDQQTKCIKI